MLQHTSPKNKGRNEELQKPDKFLRAASCAHRSRSFTEHPPTMDPKTGPPAYIMEDQYISIIYN